MNKDIYWVGSVMFFILLECLIANLAQWDIVIFFHKTTRHADESYWGLTILFHLLNSKDINQKFLLKKMYSHILLFQLYNIHNTVYKKRLNQ